jgi:hypothetical protein
LNAETEFSILVESRYVVEAADVVAAGDTAGEQRAADFCL